MDNFLMLNNGMQMPLLGLGLYRAVGSDEATTAVTNAVSMGYRLFDTASSYRNEEEVGTGIRSCGVAREEVFVTTKLWNTAQRLGNIEGAFSRSLERLGLSYVDLYLVHWPIPGLILDTWKVMEEIYLSGRARAIGVCNFDEAELSELLEHAGIVPAVNQIEYHPLYQRPELLSFCQANGIAVQASCPLARGAYLNREPLVKLAEKYHRSPAQIGLRWLVQKGISVIPKSTSLDRQLENSQIFDFTLLAEEMAIIDGLSEHFSVLNPPEDLLV